MDVAKLGCMMSLTMTTFTTAGAAVEGCQGLDPVEDDMVDRMVWFVSWLVVVLCEVVEVFNGPSCCCWVMHDLVVFVMGVSVEVSRT